MVFQIENRTGILMLFKLLPHSVKKLSVLFRGNMGRLFIGSRAIPAKCEHVDTLIHHEVDYVGNLINVCARNSSHDCHPYAVALQDCDFFNGGVKRARFAYAIMRVLHPVDGKLIFFTSHGFEPLARLIGDMEWIAENGKRNIPLFEH